LSKDYEVGDWVVFRKQKRGVAPSPRAKNLRPAQHGDEYGYEIEKYWCVCGKLPGGRIEVVTRRGKRHVVDSSDPRLRLANWLERWFLAAKFPSVTPKATEPTEE
jgi:hypothetical protein